MKEMTLRTALCDGCGKCRLCLHVPLSDLCGDCLTAAGRIVHAVGAFGFIESTKKPTAKPKTKADDQSKGV